MSMLCSAAIAPRASLRSTTRCVSWLLTSSPRRNNIDGSLNNVFRLPASFRLPPALVLTRLSAGRSSAISHLRAFDRPCWSLQSLFAASPRDLTDAEIGHLLSLAQLRVSEADLPPLRHHMQRLLAFLETVKAAEAGGCEPMHALPCSPTEAKLDAQDVASDDAPREAVLYNASWQLEDMFAVPKAIDV